jgi:uroporphyrinogen decarboxylase
MKNARFLKALAGESVDRPPIWFMRQAGRYLPEYRAVRQQAKHFLALCQNPELACEVTLQPIRRFNLDAAIIFSDILTLPNAMGMPLTFQEGEGPRFPEPIRSLEAIQNLITHPETLTDKLGYVFEAIHLAKKQLTAFQTPLIGFCGSPFTVATYMVEGRGGLSSGFKTFKTWLYQDPESLSVLLNKLAEASTSYLLGQIAAGADCVMIFDTWGGIADTPRYLSHSLDPMVKIMSGIRAKHPNFPVILFTKQGSQWLSEVAKTGCTGIGLDWTIDIQKARSLVGNKIALQGNLDPMMLYAKPDVIEQETIRIIRQHGSLPGHIMNLGHGILPDVPVEHVEAFVRAVQQFHYDK